MIAGSSKRTTAGSGKGTTVPGMAPAPLPEQSRGVTDTHRPLGTTDLSLFPIGLGCMGMSDFYGPTHGETNSIAVIHRALDEGASFLDTADMYGSGANEELVGRAIRQTSQPAFVATKFAIIRGEDGSFQGVSGRPEYVRKACDASLRRLGVEAIDLYYQHRVDPNVPIEDTVGAMAELVEAGKVRYLGLSEASASTIERANKVHPITAVQSELSLWSRDYENDVVPLCERLGISFVAYSPLGRGFLTGQIKSLDDLAPDDWRRNNPRFQPEPMKKNLEAVQKLEAWAAEVGATAAQLALAWVLSRGKRVHTIPGTRSVARLEQNLQAAQINLSSDQLGELDTLLPTESFAGSRYPATSSSLLNA